MSLEPELSLLTSPAKLESSLTGADQDPRLHVTPVILLSEKPLRSHLLQGLPDLSKARRPALMTPVLALGPSLCAVMGATPPKGPFLDVVVVGVVPGSVARSMLPSALSMWLARHVSGEQAVHTYSLGFFLGPGLPLGLGVPSAEGADRFVPVLGFEPPFFLLSLGGGARELPSSVALTALEAGDAVDSVVGSVVGATMTGVEAVTDDLPDEVDFEGAGESDGNLERSSGLSLRTIFLLCFDDLVPDLDDDGVDVDIVTVTGGDENM